jgi:hypothetical protein
LCWYWFFLSMSPHSKIIQMHTKHLIVSQLKNIDFEESLAFYIKACFCLEGYNIASFKVSWCQYTLRNGPGNFCICNFATLIKNIQGHSCHIVNCFSQQKVGSCYVYFASPTSVSIHNPHARKGELCFSLTHRMSSFTFMSPLF